MQKILLGGADFMDGPLFIGSGECKDRSIFGENGMVTLVDPGGWLPPPSHIFSWHYRFSPPQFPPWHLYIGPPHENPGSAYGYG